MIMQHATITILDKKCKALIFEGRTYVQPQFTGEVIGTVVQCTPTETGWDLLLLQEEFHMVGFLDLPASSSRFCCSAYARL